jgi:hypothetical protein
MAEKSSEDRFPPDEVAITENAEASKRREREIDRGVGSGASATTAIKAGTSGANAGVGERAVIVPAITGNQAGGAQAADPFDPAKLRIDTTTDEALGVERPIVQVRVMRPGNQMFFRVHPGPEMRLDTRVIMLEAERETYLVTPAIATQIPGETRPVRLLTCIPRIGGGVFLWPLKLPRDDRRENNWNDSARKAAELGEKKWTRMQSNMTLGAYDITTSDHYPDPVWPKVTLGELLRVAFGDKGLVNQEDHPVIRQLRGRA